MDIARVRSSQTVVERGGGPISVLDTSTVVGDYLGILSDRHGEVRLGVYVYFYGSNRSGTMYRKKETRQERR